VNGVNVGEKPKRVAWWSGAVVAAWCGGFEKAKKDDMEE
jgi:hypothetical protein